MAQPGNATAESDHMKKPRQMALVVEDEPAVQALLVDFLAILDVQADVVSTPAAALTAFIRRTYDLVLTDHKMPGQLSGLELAHRLRASDPVIPVAIVTGSLMPELAATIEAAGFSLLHKPFTLEEFVRTVTRLLAKRAPQERDG